MFTFVNIISKPMNKKLLITILWVVVNLTLYGTMMAVDREPSILLFKSIRVLLVTSLIMMVLTAAGFVKLEKSE
jgi:uncharacterized membrane protein YkvI